MVFNRQYHSHHNGHWLVYTPYGVSYALILSLSHTAPAAAPISVNASGVTTTSITVWWGAVDCINQNGNITGYLVQYALQGSREGNRTVEIANGDSSGGMHNISGLLVSTAYTIEVAAVNSAGTGVYSDPITAETLQSKWCILVFYMQDTGHYKLENNVKIGIQFKYIKYAKHKLLKQFNPLLHAYSSTCEV